MITASTAAEREIRNSRHFMMQLPTPRAMKSRDACRLQLNPSPTAVLVERAILLALDRDSELRARFLRQRWRHPTVRQ